MNCQVCTHLSTGGPSPPPSTRCHPEEAQTLATRGPANEGSPYSPRDGWPILSRTLRRLGRVPHPNVVLFDVRVGTLTLVLGCPTARPFQDARAANQSHTALQPAVILRKRRPSQREGLPTKDLCTLRTFQNPTCSLQQGGRSCPPRSRPKPTTAPAPHRNFVTVVGQHVKVIISSTPTLPVVTSLIAPLTGHSPALPMSAMAITLIHQRLGHTSCSSALGWGLRQSGHCSRIRLQHLLGVLARSVGQLGPAQHAGNFFRALLASD